jgi:hypothetical protein
MRLDVQISLVESDEWHDFVTDTGITVELSAPDVHAQNGAAKPSSGLNYGDDLQNSQRGFIKEYITRLIIMEVSFEVIIRYSPRA